MPLQGGYDIKLGDYSLMLDQSDGEGYSHYFVSEAVGRREIAGEIDGETAQEDHILFSYTDWSGGEGNRVWYPDEPTKFEFAEAMNPRIPGQLTGRPDRDSVSVTVTDAGERPYFTMGQGRLWVACDQTLRYSADQGATWTNQTTELGLAAGFKVTALVGNHEGVYVAARSATNRILRKVVVGTGSDVVASHASTNPWVGLSIMGGKLYGWTGRKLFEFDIAETLPLVLNATPGYRKVYDTGADVPYADFGGSAAGSWWADIRNSENSVIFFVGMEGTTTVYEYRFGRGVPLWDPMPFGMTTKSMRVQGGIVYFGGHWSGESVPTGGFGCMYAFSLRTLEPLHIGWFRKSQALNLQMQEMANSYGEQILISAAKSGKVFVYDKDYDAISLLDDLALGSDDKIGDMITVGQKRLVAVYSPQAAGTPTSITVYRYASDEPDDREDTGSLSHSLTEGDYDAGFPHEKKLLFGFHVTFKPLLANQRITVLYEADAAGSYTSAGVITSATPGSADGRVYLSVAGSNEKFYRLKVKKTLDNNSTSGVKQPILYGISPDVKVVRKAEYWDLKIRIKNETQERGRPLSRAILAEQIRDFITTAAALETSVTFLDGARYASKPSLFSTHTVVIEEVKDDIARTGNRQDRSAEGTCFVRLKAVPA